MDKIEESLNSSKEEFKKSIIDISYKNIKTFSFVKTPWFVNENRQSVNSL